MRRLDWIYNWACVKLV